MTKLYQVINWQYDIVNTFKTLEEAKASVDQLRASYVGEGFYVVELTVIYSSFPASSQN